jgi:hypothetical protein
MGEQAPEHRATQSANARLHQLLILGGINSRKNTGLTNLEQ